MGKQDAHPRLLQAIEYLRNNGKARTQQEIAGLMGSKQTHVSAAMRGDPVRLTEKFLTKFANAYSEYINLEYLLNGTGNLAKPKRDTRPHFPMQVAAGQTGVAISSVSESEVERRHIIGGLPTYDFTIGVTGDSMEPTLLDGDIVACKYLDSLREVKAKSIYVIETTEGAVVKQISHVSKNGLTLHSLNPKFADYDVPSDTILTVSRIVGLIRPNPQL